MSQPRFALQLALSPRPSADLVAYWDDLAAEMTGMVGDPDRASLVVTDRFADVVSELQRDVPYEHGGVGEAAPPYDPTKPDGSLATARTLPLSGRTVVVVNAGLPEFGIAAARRIVHHETQHVRLHQNNESAWAMQRRAPFERPRGFGFDYIYLAQALIDEFRCEAAIAPEVAGAADELNETAAGYAAIAALFVDIREGYFRTRDLGAAYEALLGALNRLGPYLAYATATIARAETTLDAWTDVEPMELATEALLSIPPADAIHGYANLSDDVNRVVLVLDAISKRLGFEIGVDEDADEKFLYFR